MRKIKGIWLFTIGLLVYSRFVNLSWGLPYPFHPDERNLAVALIQLTMTGNPHFFAYGQFPLYLGYLLHFGRAVGLESAIIMLRFISATASIGVVYFAFKILRQVFSFQFSVFNEFLIYSIFIFSPALIQFAHFGTTESLLMFFYTAIIYYSLKYLDDKIPDSKFYILSSIFSGLAIATKVSSIIFIALPVLIMHFVGLKHLFKTHLKIIGFLALTFFVGVTFSFHNLIYFNDFISSLQYESAVALGQTKVFYTRQFETTIPVIFQFTKIFPYALGWPAFALGILGFLGLSWRDKKINFLRFAFLIYFLPTAFIFVKWTRFMTPVMPLMLIFSALLFRRLRNITIITIITIITVIPGIAYLSIYQKPDVRFTASDWIYKNIPANSKILSETANVVDLPIQAKSQKLITKNYQVIPFNFYDLDTDKRLQEELSRHISKSDYIFIPSRRIFMNHPKDKYPVLNKYYEDLSSGKLGFKKVAEFNSYPKLKTGNWKLEFSDEQAEETWTVFDHPTVRIYKRI